MQVSQLVIIFLTCSMFSPFVFYIFLIVRCQKTIESTCHSLNQTVFTSEKECVHYYLSWVYRTTYEQCFIIMLFYLFRETQHVTNLIFDFINQSTNHTFRLIDSISDHVIKISIIGSLLMSVYGWLKHTNEMAHSCRNIYFELKATTQAVTFEIWSCITMAVKSVWDTTSTIKLIQFCFFLILLMSIPDTIEYIKKAFIKLAKL